jgi:endonuclease/exonuclease/phosphatase family metal-dependent hydrolase
MVRVPVIMLNVLAVGVAVVGQVARYVPIRSDGLLVAAVPDGRGSGRGDPPAVVALARDSADVLVVQEMTPQAASRLSAAGLDDMFQHRVIDPRDGAAGIGIWSRYPIGESGSMSGYAMPMLRARIRVPEVVTEPTVVAVHLAAPWVQPVEHWQQDMARLPSTLHELARDGGAGAVIVAGDLNATFDWCRSVDCSARAIAMPPSRPVPA